MGGAGLFAVVEVDSTYSSMVTLLINIDGSYGPLAVIGVGMVSVRSAAFAAGSRGSLAVALWPSKCAMDNV